MIAWMLTTAAMAMSVLVPLMSDHKGKMRRTGPGLERTEGGAMRTGEGVAMSAADITQMSVIGMMRVVELTKVTVSTKRWQWKRYMQLCS